MKTPRTGRPARALNKLKERKRTDYEQALRQCELAAAQIKSTSEELAACWATLGRELPAGASATELLRRRAWCNVLELRLREQARALEAARHGMDAVWNDVMLAARGGELFKRFRGKVSGENLFHKSWSFLLQPKAASALRSKPSAISK
jgi:flagellar biosynthesis chaperone FliJ